MINNLLAFIYDKIGIKQKNKLKVFQIKLYEALVSLFKFIYQTLVIYLLWYKIIYELVNKKGKL